MTTTNQDITIGFPLLIFGPPVPPRDPSHGTWRIQLDLANVTLLDPTDPRRIPYYAVAVAPRTPDTTAVSALMSWLGDRAAE